MPIKPDKAAAHGPPTARPKTGRPCVCCNHPDREIIDHALIAGEPLPSISSTFGITPKSLMRHRCNHIPTPAMAAGAAERAAEEGQRGASLVDSAADLRDKALSLLAQAEKAGDLKVALIGVREAARCLELMAKLTGEIDDSARLNIVVAPVLVELQTVILGALAGFPAARAAVIAALAHVTGGPLTIEHMPAGP
jgi:hypothetical protein